MLGKQAIQSGAPRSIAKLSYKPHENSCYLRIINYSEIGIICSNVFVCFRGQTWIIPVVGRKKWTNFLAGERSR